MVLGLRQRGICMRLFTDFSDVFGECCNELMRVVFLAFARLDGAVCMYE